jgi:hypothetical protein
MRKLASPKTGSGRPQHGTVTVTDIMKDRDEELGQTLRPDLPSPAMQGCIIYGETAGYNKESLEHKNEISGGNSSCPPRHSKGSLSLSP